MMTRLKLFALMALITSSLFAQHEMPPYLEGKITYPAIDLDTYMGVIKTENTALKYDPSLNYKIVIDVSQKVSDSTEINSALSEVARTYNLNIENGVPKDKLHMAVVVHAKGMFAFLNKEAYQEKYGVKNPNTVVIKKLSDLGVNFYICSQSMGFFNLPNEDLDKNIQVTISAKTAFITLDQMGYSYLDVNED